MPGEPASSRRFEIALSFPGEHRGVVEAVAHLLAERFSQERVLYDRYHRPEFSRLNLDVHLPNLYRTQSELIVVFLCPEYPLKEWCGLEFRYIRQLIGTPDEDRIMLLSVGDPGDLSSIGILRRDGYADILNLQAEEICDDILSRLHLNRGHTPPPSAPSPAPNHGPIHLPQPRLGDLFTGRADDLKRLSDTHFIAPHQPGQKPLILHGPPGVGKTTLACELLYHLHDLKLLSRIHHIPAADPAALPTLLADLAATVGAVSTAYGPEDPATAHRELVKWLGRPELAGKVLLYFDNADTPTARGAVLAEIKALGYPRALVTSRRNDWPHAHCHSVAVWTPRQAAEYLHKCSMQMSGADIQLLTAALGGLPLAFHLAAALIKNQHYRASELLNLWLTKLPGQKIPDRDGQPTIAALLAVSLDTLDDDALTLLQILSFYAPQKIPEKLISACAIANWRESLGSLHSASLVVWESCDSTITLHPFIREAILQDIPATSWEDFLNVSSEMLHRYLPPPSWTRDRWLEWPLLLHHCQAFACHAARPGLVPTPSSLWAPPLVRIINEAAMHYCEKAAFREAEALLREALRIDRAKFGKNHPEVAIRLSNLSSALQDTDRVSEAEALIREALQIHRTTHGDDHEKVARGLNNLAQLLQAAGRWSEAEPLMREGLEIERSAKGSEHPHVGIQLSNLARLLQATDRRPEAEPLLREALRISSAAFGNDHPQVAVDLSNLARLLYDTERYSEAEPMMRDALRLNRAAYGDNHPRVADNVNNLACLLEATDRLPEAEPLRWDLLRIDHAKHGEDHPSVACDRNILISLLQAMDRLPEAESLLRDALRIARAAYGGDHPRVAFGLNSLACLLSSTNRLSEAEPLMRDAVRILHDSLGPEHLDTVAALQNLDTLLEEMKIPSQYSEE